MPTSVAGCVCVYICPVRTFIWKHDTLKYDLRLWHLTKTILPMLCWFSVTCWSKGIGFASLSLVFLRSGMTQSVSTEDTPLSVSAPLPVPLISSSVSLLILTSELCHIACTGGERLPISCLLSSCCAFSSCQQALLQVVLVATVLYKSLPPSISSAKSSFFCF